MLRGIFQFDDEPHYWQQAIKDFDNRVPRFDSKNEAIAFTKQFCHKFAGTDPAFQHSISLLTSWSQIETILLPKIKEYNAKWESSFVESVNLEENRLYSAAEMDEGPNRPPNSALLDYIKSRLNLKLHQYIVPEVSTMNTLRYLFYHMKCGIYAMIRNNELVVFCPFSNKDYTNSWSTFPEVESSDGSLAAYYAEKERTFRHENVIPKQQWWANGNIICNEQDEQGWGDHFLFQLKDMLSETCRCRKVPDCEFFVNKRDYPQLKYSKLLNQPVEPYGFIFNRDDRVPEEDLPLSDNLYESYTPILSFYSSDRFADIPFPPSEDWEAATGKVFPASFKHSMVDGEVDDASIKPPRDLFTTKNLEKFEVPWEAKRPIAFFRGTATGGGVTTATNQRLHISALSEEWSHMPERNGSGGTNSSNNSSSSSSAAASDDPSSYPFLDAKIVGWNMRDKKIARSKMTFIKKSNFRFVGQPKSNFVEIYKQGTYKYVVYVEGHCAACRYGFMMLLGSVILKVDSLCVADQMWYFPLLVSEGPHQDHVRVKSDLSDLAEKIQWCRDNDDQCRLIAANARRLYERVLCRDGILDYMQGIMVEIAKRRVMIPSWARPLPQTCEPPRCSARVNAYCDENDFCALCKARQEAKAAAHAESTRKATTTKAVSEEDERAERLRLMRKRKKDEEIERIRAAKKQS